MRRHWLVVALALCAVLVLPTAASARVKPLFAAMGGENVVAPDGTPSPGDTNGGGSFTAIIDGRWLCYGIALRDLSPLIAVSYMAHVHVGDASTTGDVLIRLNAPLTADPGSSHGCVWLDELVAEKLTKEALASPGGPENPLGYYADIHSPSYPLGAARGQLFAVQS